jgi:hypothetical protein
MILNKNTAHLIVLYISSVSSIYGLTVANSWAVKHPEQVFGIFQFPADKIPCIDSNTIDWDIVPDSLVIGTEFLFEEDSRGTNIDKNDIDIKMKVGWVKKMNRLYFLYEASDDFWDFSGKDLHNDILELVVDGNLSGGPFIKEMNPNINIGKPESNILIENIYFTYQGVHAQNYHIFTPPGDKDWTMVWGAAQWIKDLPFANHAYSYNFRHGEKGKLILEFFITPFDYTAYAGPTESVESNLTENAEIGLSWVVLDYDGPGKRHGAYNLSGKSLMYADASDLRVFRLLPLDNKFRKPLEAFWIFKVIDFDKRTVAFFDKSYGTINAWLWDFGDGVRSSEQCPIHTFDEAGVKTVTLRVKGPEGEKSFMRVWNIVLK